ncbi:LysR family transcriptional regulator, partial [Chromohalobacter sp. HP20-39]|nr:LysR family transcriptional regulator [Chromohalobacter sp. HP20-39]
AVSAGLGVSLLPASCMQPGHRMLSTADGFPEIGGLELALFARSDLDSAGRVLRDRLVEMCSERATALQVGAYPA